MKYTILLLSFLLVSCSRPAESVQQTSNSSYSYEVLFTRNGCEFGRFYDGRRVYTVICDNATTQTSHLESCGKNCTREQITSTHHVGEATQ